MRLLVIVSSDYGELGTTIYFLQGLRSTPPPVVLLPASLAQAMPAIPGHELRSYAELADIEQAIVEFRPDTALLASGYLLAINSCLSLLDLLSLLRLLRRRRVALLTSDPYLGLLPSPASLPLAGLRTADGRKAFIASCVLSPIRHLLRDAWHIYPAPIERLPAASGARRLSYFNAVGQDALASAPEPGGPPLWVFILAKVDCAMLLKAQGDRFVACLVARLKECLALGRQALLIGPEHLVKAVRERIGERPELSAYSEIPYASYMQSLLAAEYAFYWNYLSFSLIYRVLANRPVFYFDEGHLPHIFPAVGEAGIRLFYDGWRPPLLSMDRPLELQDLMPRAAEVMRQFRRIGDGMRGCPSPEQILQLATGHLQT